MLNRAESWRAPFQGANQSQVLWAWIFYLYTNEEGFATLFVRNWSYRFSIKRAKRIEVNLSHMTSCGKPEINDFI